MAHLMNAADIADRILRLALSHPVRGMASQAALRSYEWSDSNAEAVCERTDAINNFRNTLEQVHVVGGVQAGVWSIIVRSGGLAQAPQPFAIMISAQ
jgi:hypothetical protein